MADLRRWIERRIGRRNLPFLAVVAALAAVIIVLMVYSPPTESNNGPRDPTRAMTD